MLVLQELLIRNKKQMNSTQPASHKRKHLSTEDANPVNIQRDDTEHDNVSNNEFQDILNDEILPAIDGVFEDSLDDVILVRLDQREQQVSPGERVTFRLTVLNNGPKSASFSVRVEGWVKNGWVLLSPTHTRLAPGESHRFELTIAPPALSRNAMADLKAGERPFLITVHSPSYPQKQSRLAAKIDLLPVVRFTLGTPQPKRLHSSWQNQSATTIVPVTNHGNAPAHIILEGASRGKSRKTACQFELMTIGAVGHSLGQSQVTLQPEQTIQVHVRIKPVERVIFGFGAEILPFCIAAWAIDIAAWAIDSRFINSQNSNLVSSQISSSSPLLPPLQAQTTHGQIKRVPLVGVGLAAAAASMVLFTLVAAGLLGLTTLMAILPAARGLQPSAPAIVMRAPEQAPLEIVFKVAEPVPSPRTLADVASPERAMLTVADALVAQSIMAENNEAAGSLAAENQAAGQVAESDPQEFDQSRDDAGDEATVIVPREVAPLQPIQYMNGVPIVQAGMISSPDFAPANNEQLTGADRASGDRVAINPDQNISPQGGSLVSADSVQNPINVTVSQPSTLTYERMFKEVAHSFDLDWRILAAQAYVESGFDPLATGTKGDMGLMQILPSTWAEWAGRTGATDPYNGYHSVSVAAVYSDYLRDIFAAQGYTDPKWRLVAYNWGPNRLRAFLNDGRPWDELPEGRKKYARDILRIASSLPPE